MSATVTELILVLSTYSGLLFRVVITLPTPTTQVKCLAEHFYDEVAMTNHSCTICFTREGTQFQRQCESICNCTVIKAITSQQPVAMTTAVQPLLGNTTHSSVSTTSRVISSSVDNTRANLIITLPLVAVVVLGVSVTVIICLYRRKRQPHSTVTEEQHQGCFSGSSDKRPTQCSDREEESIKPRAGRPS